MLGLRLILHCAYLHLHVSVCDAVHGGRSGAQVAGEARVSDLEAPAGYGYNGYGWLGRVWVSRLIHLPAVSPTITVSRSAVGVSYRRRRSSMRKARLAKTSCLRSPKYYLNK